MPIFVLKKSEAVPKLPGLTLLEEDDVFGVVEGEKKEEVIAEMAGEKEVVTDVLAAIEAQLPGVVGGVKELFEGEGGAFDGMTKKA